MQSTGPVPVQRSQPRGERLGSVDLWRGFVLCTIFINHVPGNPFERLTYRNFGFSDSAEAFVFISGLSVALAYRRRVAAGETGPIVVGLGRRALKIYGVHLLLSLLGIAIFAVGAGIFSHAQLMEPHGRDLVIDDPVAAVIGTLSLGHQFGYFNILPLYVLLVAFAPVLLLLSRFGLATMLGVSAAIYGVTRLTGLNIPTWPMRGEWFFDPFAWQLLMAIGIACGLGFARPSGLAGRLTIVLAGLVVTVSAFCATDGFGWWPGLFDVMRGAADLDKTMLGLGRLLHFLSLAAVVAGLHVAEAMRGMPWFKPLCLMGRHGLAIFFLLSLLAAVGQVLTIGLGHSGTLDAVVVGGGLAILYGCAVLLETYRPTGARLWAAVRHAGADTPSSGRTTL